MKKTVTVQKTLFGPISPSEAVRCADIICTAGSGVFYRSWWRIDGGCQLTLEVGSEDQLLAGMQALMETGFVVRDVTDAPV